MSDAEAAGTPKRPRIQYIDNIRILLICLVIATHTSITYGGPGQWYFTDPGNTGMPYILELVDSLNQSFFMGFFALVSAYFLVPSLLRKGRETFARDRLVRLGIPLLAWILVLAPILDIILTTAAGSTASPAALFIAHFVPFHGLMLGPMWFVAFLLFATGGYLLWTLYRPPADPKTLQPRPFPSFPAILIFGLLLGLVTACVRVFLPIGTNWYFQFQPPFFAQYIALFIVGIYAAENRWLDAIPDRVGKAAVATALALIVIQGSFLIVIGNSPAGIGLITGGLQATAVLYAIWEQLACVTIITSLLWIFSRLWNAQGPVAAAMAGGAYTVYIIHPLVLVPLSIALVGLVIPQVAKFALVLLLTIAISFALAHAIRAVPGVKRVL